MNDVTQILERIEYGDPSQSEKLLPLIYEELRRMASAKLANEKPGQTLQPTALVHEAYIRLVTGEARGWNSRGHFFAAAAEAMRRILIDQARRKMSLRAGGDRYRVELAECAEPSRQDEKLDLMALDDALTQLERRDPRKAELVKLRYFAGLTNRQAAEALGISTSTADADWSYAKAWLRAEMSDD